MNFRKLLICLGLMISSTLQAQVKVLQAESILIGDIEYEELMSSQILVIGFENPCLNCDAKKIRKSDLSMAEKYIAKKHEDFEAKIKKEVTGYRGKAKYISYTQSKKASYQNIEAYRYLLYPDTSTFMVSSEVGFDVLWLLEDRKEQTKIYPRTKVSSYGSVDKLHHLFKWLNKNYSS